jgi:hypothetical protein
MNSNSRNKPGFYPLNKRRFRVAQSEQLDKLRDHKQLDQRIAIRYRFDA